MNRSPLAGRRVVVTRATDQASELARLLASAGATVIAVPTIAIEPPDDGGAAVRGAIAGLAAGEWLAVTSANGAAAVLAATSGIGPLGRVRIACVGPKTAAVFEAAGVAVDLVAERFVAEGLVDAFGLGDGTRVVVAQAAGARGVLAEGLGAAGWAVQSVVAYRTVPAALSDESRTAIAGADIATFTSASTVQHLVAAVGVDGVPPVVACIGPVTAAAARELGLHVSIEAGEHTVVGLVAALIESSPLDPPDMG